MVVSPCTTFTLPAKVASFFLSRISSVAASIWIGWSRVCEKPCMALGTHCTEICARASPAASHARRRPLRTGFASREQRQRKRQSANRDCEQPAPEIASGTARREHHDADHFWLVLVGACRALGCVDTGAGAGSGAAA